MTTSGVDDSDLIDDPRPTGPDSTMAEQTAAAEAARPARPDPGPAGPAPAGPGREAAGARAWPARRIFWAAFTAAIAVALAYLTLRTLADVASELVLIILALVFAFGLDPVVSWLVRHGMRRVLAVAVVTLGFLLIVIGTFAAIIPPIVTQVGQFIDAIPSISHQLQDKSTWIGRLNDHYHLLDSVRSKLSAGGGGLPVGGILGVGAAIFGTFASVVTVVVLTVYFLANLPMIRRAAYRFVPASRRERVVLLGDEITARIGGYVLGNVITSVVAGVGTLVFLEVVRVPYAVALGLLVAVLDLIPVVGSTIGGALVTLVALTVSLPVALASLVFYILYRLLEDYLLMPRVMDRAVNVPPVLTIVALLIGGSLLGIVGAFLAIPAAAAVELIVTEVAWPKIEGA
ncbi:MAG: AI-2E family transporter [Pseudonocardiales bacterium]|nr:MAG: AI-2E family transporter [Pseudonocardiales bacterium]